MKRKIAVLLVLALMLSMVPVEVFAVSSEENSQTEATQSIPETQQADAENELEIQSSVEPDVQDLEESDANPVQQSENIVESGTCGDNLTWSLDSEGTLIISGTGKMKNYYFDASPTPWADFKNQIISVLILLGNLLFTLYTRNAKKKEADLC